MVKPLAALLLLALSFGLQGCVSFGVECASRDSKAWVKVKRFGWGVSNRQAEAVASYREKVCR